MDTGKPLDLIRSFLEQRAATFKLVWVVVLILLLLIPLNMIRSVLRERMGRHDQAIAGISASWGGEQTVVGPVLVIPYEYRAKVWKERIVDGKKELAEVEETAAANIFVLPDDLIVEGTIIPSTLHRGIYDAVVYEGSLDISGRFPVLDFTDLGVSEEDIHWEKAVLTVAVTDLRGTGKMLTVDTGVETAVFRPGCWLPGYGSGITARLAGVEEQRRDLSFQITLGLKGSRGLSLAPLGKQNGVKLTSPWAAPSFRGAFLPTERKVSEEGFEASWEIAWYGRNYPQMSTDRASGCALTPNAISPSLFGVDCLMLVDTYRMVERATKYGMLFIGLIFTAFFLFEVLSALSIHTLQYTLVGAALCLFYLAVLSLSEFIPFAYAYWAGAGASMALIVLYSFAILKGGWRTTVIAVALLGIYTYLYVVLQLQDYSLIFGTAALFAVLGIVMYTTRNLDWSKRR